MLIEQRKDLGDTRLANQAWIVVVFLVIVGLALVCFTQNLHWRAAGELFLGIGVALFVAPRLAIWKA